MSTFNSHESTQPRRRDKGGKAEPGALRPDPARTVIAVPAPRKLERSLTDVDTERADWEGMIPNKPTNPAEP
jgi:hypothetical protein